MILGPHGHYQLGCTVDELTDPEQTEAAAPDSAQRGTGAIARLTATGSNQAAHADREQIFLAPAYVRQATAATSTGRAR